MVRKHTVFFNFQKPVLEPPFIESYQRVCTYNRTRLVTVKLPNCQPNVDPTYTYPVALRCDCGVCLTSTTECITSVWSLNRDKLYLRKCTFCFHSLILKRNIWSTSRKYCSMVSLLRCQAGKSAWSYIFSPASCLDFECRFESFSFLTNSEGDSMNYYFVYS